MVTDSATRSARGRSPHLAVPATETQSPGRQPCLSCYRSLTLVSSADRHPRAQTGPHGHRQAPAGTDRPHGHKATKEVHVHSSWRGER